MKTKSQFRFTILALIGVVSTLGLSTCGDTITSPKSDIDPPVDTASAVSFFPNSRNVVWKYVIYDSLASEIEDTLTITIRDELGLASGELARVWERYFHITDTLDTVFVRVASDSVQFYDSRFFAFDWGLFLLPLLDDNRWANPGLGSIDSSGVQAIDSISVEAGEFPIAARVLDGWIADFQTDGNVTTSWVVDSVGIVQRQLLEKVVNFGDTTISVNKVWRLLSSSLVVPPVG